MAELILTSAARAAGAALPSAFRAIGTALLQAGASAVGRGLDDQIFGTARRREGARLTDLHIQGSTEGASIPSVYGRVRIAGQVIWAARFKETTQTQSTGGKGGPRVKTKTYAYSISFAVGLCEGEIARIGRVWANGASFDLSKMNWRLHKGTQVQEPDALIEAIEGAESAPAYRGLAYIVFEDLPLEEFGNTIPQLSFEIVRAPSSGAERLEDMARGVCLIPGSGEFVYATEPIRRVLGPGREITENVHARESETNFTIAIDQLAEDLPNVENVLLVVSWFGTDLRCAECEIRPGVETHDKVTKPQTWRVNGVSRGDAYVVSQIDGGPAYGGTPSDVSVVQAIQALKARGYKVGLYPFILMDVPADNALPDPYGAAAQAAYPWRGRINVHPAPGEDGTPDKTGAAGTQLAAFVGTAEVAHFGSNANGVTYSGPDEWSYRRFILHHAKLAQAAGGVDFFLIGSELRGLTTARSSASAYPFVSALEAIASDARELLDNDETKITYAADWSEYFGHQPQDGSGDVFFHLDPLWMHDDIDAVAIDWYAPLTDWRDGAAHADRDLARTIYDPAYLEGRIEAGENFDWFYASDADRAAQTRTPIADGAYAKPWVFRAKDVRSWWNEHHYNRPGGVEDATPTAWEPGAKPIFFTELGCPAVDKGANTPNLFIDPKSSESALPYFSSGARDDLIQRRTLEAYLRHWEGDGVVDPDGMFLWCWDSRPHPQFPAREDVWSDGASWRLGHWLSGRAGMSELASVVADICARSDVADAQTSALAGAVGGLVIDAPSSARDALAPLMQAFAFNAVEREGVLAFEHKAVSDPSFVSRDELTAEAAGAAHVSRADSAEIPIEARVRFLDSAQDYRIASVSARRRDAAEGGVASLDAPLALDAEQAEAMAKRVLMESRARAETMEIALAPQALAHEPGDLVALENESGVFEIARIEDAETRRLTLRRAAAAAAHASAPDVSAGSAPSIAPTPDAVVLDLPLLPGAEDDERPLVAIYADPWKGAHDVYAGPDGALATLRAEAPRSAVVGELVWALWPGPIDRWDDGNVIRVRMSGPLASVSKAAALNGANMFAVETGEGWEIVQARNATLVGGDEYELSGFLRGQFDTVDAMASPAPVGARIVKLDERCARLDVAAHEWGETLALIIPPFGGDTADADALTLGANLPHRAARPFAPCLLSALRDGAGNVAIAWVRRARMGGDAWGAGEPPIGESAERYRLEMLDGETVVRSVETSSPAYTYAATDQTADFGGLPPSLSLRVAQIASDGVPGRAALAALTL